MLTLDGTGQLCAVPGIYLAGAGRDQLRGRPRRMAGQLAAIFHLSVLDQNPVNSGDRPRIDAVVE